MIPDRGGSAQVARGAIAAENNGQSLLSRAAFIPVPVLVEVARFVTWMLMVLPRHLFLTRLIAMAMLI